MGGGSVGSGNYLWSSIVFLWRCYYSVLLLPGRRRDYKLNIKHRPFNRQSFFLQLHAFVSFVSVLFSWIVAVYKLVYIAHATKADFNRIAIKYIV